MKKLILIISISAFLVLCVLTFLYFNKTHTVSDIANIKLEQVKGIELQNGATGKKIIITDKEEIIKVKGFLETIKCKPFSKELTTGFWVRISILNADNTKSECYFDTSDYININRKYYKIKGNLPNYDFFKKYSIFQ